MVGPQMTQWHRQSDIYIGTINTMTHAFAHTNTQRTAGHEEPKKRKSTEAVVVDEPPAKKVAKSSVSLRPDDKLLGKLKLAAITQPYQAKSSFGNKRAGAPRSAPVSPASTPSVSRSSSPAPSPRGKGNGR
jgi:hypothetical protein